MVMADKQFNLQEYISMGFYCLVGTGVIVHWIHVWLGKPDYRVRELEARLRSLEEGDRIRDKFALASLGAGYPHSVSSSRRGSTTACNTVHGGNNPIFAGCNESLFQQAPTTPSKRLRAADSYFDTVQHSENVSPHDCTPPPLVFPKPPPSAGRSSQPASPVCRSPPVSPTAGPPGQALCCSGTTPYNNNSGNMPAAHALSGPLPLSKLSTDMFDTAPTSATLRRPSDAATRTDTAASLATSNINDDQQTSAAATSPGPRSPPSRPLSSNNSKTTSRSRSHSSFRSHSHQRLHHHQPHRYGFHYPHLPPVNSGADNRVGHIAGMVGPGPLSD